MNNTANNYKKVCKLISFGDSNTDTGNAFYVSKKVLELPNPPNRAVLKPIPGSWCKRASNGILSVEVLSNLFNIPLYNYSIGGAGTDYKNIFYWMNTFSDTGFLGQIEKYKKDLKGRTPCKNDLHSIYIGGNAPFTYRPPISIDEATTLAVNDIKKGIENLINLGASKFIVFNLFDLSLTPYSIERGQEEYAKQLTLLINTKLKSMLKEFKSYKNIEIIEFDLYSVINNIVKNPTKYGITDITSKCHPKDPQKVPQSLYPCMACNCLFWDDYHVTRVVNNITGKTLYSILLSKGFF